VKDSYDAIGLLLILKLSHLQWRSMARRGCAVLDEFFEQVAASVWPRICTVVDANLRSVKTSNLKKLGPIDRSPHYATRRFAEYTCSMLLLAQGIDGGGLETVSNEQALRRELAALRGEIVGLLSRLSQTLPSPRLRVVFLINNYDQAVAVFRERHLKSPERTALEELLAQQRQRFVEEELREGFAEMIQLVKAAVGGAAERCELMTMMACDRPRSPALSKTRRLAWMYARAVAKGRWPAEVVVWTKRR